VKHFVVYTIVFGLLLTACAGRSARAQSQGEPFFSVELKNSNDQITIQYENDTTIIAINSPRGIGSATFTLESGTTPQRIMVQLHLNGLEEFRLIAEQNIISASIPSSGRIQVQSQRKISGNYEQVLRPNDLLWLDIQIISDSQKIPLKDGYFEIIFPEEFIRESGNSFEIQWIDFYR
jgi:hypothetical protein